MPNYAVHDGVKVFNVIVADFAEVAEQITGMDVVETTGVPWIGWAFNGERWLPPQPYPSWTLSEDYDWQPPTPMPNEGMWTWDEDALAWVEIDLAE